MALASLVLRVISLTCRHLCTRPSSVTPLPSLVNLLPHSLYLTVALLILSGMGKSRFASVHERVLADLGEAPAKPNAAAAAPAEETITWTECVESDGSITKLN